MHKNRICILIVLLYYVQNDSKSKLNRFLLPIFTTRFKSFFKYITFNSKLKINDQKVYYNKIKF